MGIKLKQVVVDGGSPTSRYYFDGSEYDNNKVLSLIHMDEGVINHSAGTFTHEYFIKDHLGNTRVAFEPGANNTVLLTQSTDYYPFGMSLSSQYNNTPFNKYLYNGKELQDEALDGVKLDWYDYGARFYDPQIGRWSSVDPLAEMDYSGSPFGYVSNSPVNLIDPDGRYSADFNDENATKKSSNYFDDGPRTIASTHTNEKGDVLAVYNDGDLGIYVHPDGITKTEIDKKHSKSNTSAGGTEIGETYYWDEFRAGDRILFGQSWNNELVDLACDGCTEGKGSLAWNSRSGKRFDIKSKYQRGTGKMLNGKYISAESAGNFLAGFNAGGRNGLSFIKYMQLAGAYHQAQSLQGPLSNVITGNPSGLYPWFGEIDYAGRMIVWGWLTKSPQDKEATDASEFYNSKIKK
jgi:RHS repeat-associated protein